MAAGINGALRGKLLPPLKLYRNILRAHRTLAPQHRLLGDSYVRSEFKAHKSVEDPVQLISFLSQWQKYLNSLTANIWQKETIDPQIIDKLSDDKLVQLHELKKAAEGSPEQE